MLLKRSKFPSPFESPSKATTLEWCWIVVCCCTLVPLVRLLVLILISFLVFFWCLIISQLFKCLDGNSENEGLDKHISVTRGSAWRCAILKCPQQVAARLFLFTLGFFWITVEDLRMESSLRTVPIQSNAHYNKNGVLSENIRVIVANHTTILDIVMLMWFSMPAFLASQDIFKVPIIGLVGSMNEMIGVSREERSSRDAVKSKIRAHVSYPNSPPLVIFPEGTTSRNDALLQFKVGGAFSIEDARGTIQPIVLRYGKSSTCCRTFNVENTPATDTKMWLLRLLCAPFQFVTLYLLPVADPTSVFNGLGPTGRGVHPPTFLAETMKMKMATILSMNMGTGEMSTGDCEANLTDQSYEELYLWNLGVQQLNIPQILLRTLDFKHARSAVSENSDDVLTIGAAKASLRAYAFAYRCSCEEDNGVKMEVQGVTYKGLQQSIRTLRGPTADGSFTTRKNPNNSDPLILWCELLTQAGDGTPDTSPSEPGGIWTASGCPVSLDFQQFLVGMHRVRPQAAVAAGWLHPFDDDSNTNFQNVATEECEYTALVSCHR